MPQIEKLIKEYRWKIEFLDRDIALTTENQEHIRRDHPETWRENSDYFENSLNLQKFRACRQIYVQVISDLENLK